MQPIVQQYPTAIDWWGEPIFAYFLPLLLFLLSLLGFVKEAEKIEEEEIWRRVLSYMVESGKIRDWHIIW